MNRLFLVLGLLVICAVALSFYMGWFHIGSDSADGKSNVTFSVDREKFKEDRISAQERMQHLGNPVKEKTEGPTEKSIDGTMVSVSADKLLMTNKDGKEHHHPLAGNVKVTCDGKTCLASDLKGGMRIRVTTENAEPHAATRIEALDNNPDFEKGA